MACCYVDISLEVGRRLDDGNLINLWDVQLVWCRISVHEADEILGWSLSWQSLDRFWWCFNWHSKNLRALNLCQSFPDVSFNDSTRNSLEFHLSFRYETNKTRNSVAAGDDDNCYKFYQISIKLECKLSNRHSCQSSVVIVRSISTYARKAFHSNFQCNTRWLNDATIFRRRTRSFYVDFWLREWTSQFPSRHLNFKGSSASSSTFSTRVSFVHVHGGYSDIYSSPFNSISADTHWF